MTLHWIRNKTLKCRRSGAVFQRALRHQQGLKQTVDGLLAGSTGSGVDVAQLQQALGAAQNHIKGLQDFFSNCLHPCFYTNQPTSKSAKIALKVFETPELAEEILTYLPVLDLLRAQQVNRMMRDVVQASTKLQRQLFLKPGQTKHLRVLNLGDGSKTIDIGTDDEPEFTADEKIVELLVTFAKWLPRLGSRVRRMQLCQPPIHVMRYVPTCCGQASEDEIGGHPLRIRNEEGLTLGDLRNAAENLMAKHKLCLNAPVHAYDPDGFVRPEVRFYVGVALEADDPMVRERLEEEKENMMLDEDEEAHEAKITEYMNAKKDGKCSTTNVDAYLCGQNVNLN